MQNNNDIVLEEYSNNRKSPFALKEADRTYLESDIFHPSGQSTFELFKSKEKDNKYYISNSSYAGVIQLSDKRVIFSTKVKTNLFYLLSFLRDESAFIYDPEISIDIKEGVNFFDIIGRLFGNELDNIIKTGILKKYVLRQENLKYLKGKLLIKGQITNQMHGRPVLCCKYNDLTYDNQENRIVLFALKELIGLIKFNESLREELLYMEYCLRDIVSLVKATPQDCDQIEYTRINEKYRTILSFAKVIIEEKFIRSTHKGEAKGFNFIVNMNKVFEDFIKEMIREAINEDDNYNDYFVEAQLPFRSLDRTGKIKTVPDIVIRRRYSNNLYPLIIDTKYKKSDINSDYYQIISYALAIPSAEHSILLYPEGFVDEDKVEVFRNLLDPEQFINIHVKTIDLHIGEDIGYKDYIRLVKKEIKSKVLSQLINN